MYLGDGFKSAFKMIWGHKTRSFLTVLGILIGVSAVVTMFAAVTGIQAFIKTSMNQMGWNNSVMIAPADANMFFMMGGVSSNKKFSYMQRKSQPLTVGDFIALRGNVPHKYAYGSLEDWQPWPADSKSYVKIQGTNSDYFIAKTYVLESGRYFSEYEENYGGRVCVLGNTFAKRNFPGRNMTGQTIKLMGANYTVVGVLAPDVLNKGNGINFSSGDRQWDLKAIYLPLGEATRAFDQDDKISTISFQSADADSYRSMYNSINQILLARHGMSHDFSFNDIGSMMLKITTEMDKMLKKWKIMLFCIASISLLVGGIGLFSTLLISIGERMMEIGVRKSLGATEFDIFTYFIAESITLALVGAGLGLGLTSALIMIISQLVKTTLPIPWSGVALGMGFAFFIGLASGFYPALKAAKLNPVQAIYYNE